MEVSGDSKDGGDGTIKKMNKSRPRKKPNRFFEFSESQEMVLPHTGVVSDIE